MRGYFITLEGGEGSGKSTLLNELADYLTQHHFEVVKTREPGGTRLGEMIRYWLLNHQAGCAIADQAELLLFLAARAQHIDEVIEPAVKQGKIVLCDRFNDSTIAYQGSARNLDIVKVKHLCETVCGPVVPDLTLFLDVDPEVGLLRTMKLEKDQANAGEFDRIEQEALSFHKNVQAGFRALAMENPGRIVRIDANQSRDLVIADAIQVVESRIGSFSPKSCS